jgi:hypothetical protein
VKFKFISVEKTKVPRPFSNSLHFFIINLDLLAAASITNNYQLQTNHSHILFFRVWRMHLQRGRALMSARGQSSKVHKGGCARRERVSAADAPAAAHKFSD